jgi:methionyl-tRNA formyltransferase
LPPGTVIDAGLTIACGSGGLRPRLVQRAGRPVMDIAALLRGWPVNVGAKVDRG